MSLEEYMMQGSHGVIIVLILWMWRSFHGKISIEKNGVTKKRNEK